MDKQHLKCLLWKGLWIAGALSLVAAWFSVNDPVGVWGYNVGIWFWNALIFAALSIPVKLDCHSCSVCMPGKS